jgi:hypothetical protein
MWIDAVPSVVMLTIVGWYVARHFKQPVLQVHALITASYLNLFPMLNYLLSDRLGMESFSYYQWLIVLLFQLPLLLITHLTAGSTARVSAYKRELAALSPWLPWMLLIVLAGFWYVALGYDLFYRRIGHMGLQRNTAEVPVALLYFYRIAVETSFFVMMFLLTTLNYVAPNSRYYWRYKMSLLACVGSFVPFYIANSRMHFVLLILCIFCTQPRTAHSVASRFGMLPLSLATATLVLCLTLLRELLLEDNGRLETGDVVDMLHSASSLIAARLDSLSMLNELDLVGFKAWGFDLTGMAHTISFNVSFFTDPETYRTIKESLITSPSVKLVNELLFRPEVDFPKSMILDMLLSFGVTGLIVTAVLLGTMIGRVQHYLNSFRGFSLAFLGSLYALPMLLEFEKEFVGFLLAFIKWIPALIFIYWQRPRFGNRRASEHAITSMPHQSA